MNRWHWSVVAAALALAPAARADDSSTLKDEKDRAEQKTEKAWNETKEEARETGSAAEQEMTQAKEEAQQEGREVRASADEGTGSAATAAGVEAKDQLTKEEKKILQKLHASSQMEIGMARIAKDNAQNEKVKELAEKIQEDHQDVVDDVSELARERNVDLAMHDSMDANRKHVEQMQKMTGARFDQHYAQMMAQEHKKEIAELRKAQSRIRNEDVKEIVDDALPKLEEHQKLALEAQREIGGERQGRRAPMTGARDTRTGSATSDTGTSGNTAADANTSSTGATSEDATTWGNESSREAAGEQPKATGSSDPQDEQGGNK